MRVGLSKLLQGFLVSAFVAGVAAAETCSTSFGTKSLAHVPRTTTTDTKHATSTATVHARTPTVTSARRTISTTEISTYTTTSYTGSTASGTITNYEITFTTKVKTHTAPPTTTTSTSTIVYYVSTMFTSTAPPPPGFTPVLDTLPGSKAKKKRSMNGRLQKRARFPAKVLCTVVETKTTVATTTVTPQPKTVTSGTITETKSKTKTVTSTIIFNLPPPSTFVTETSTYSTTTTYTPVRTTTVTTATESSVGPTSTVYAACQTGSNNYAGSVNYYGNPAGPDNVRAPSGVTFSYTEDLDQVSCCMDCFNTANCLVSVYNAHYAGQLDACRLFMGVNTTTAFAAGTGNAFAPDDGLILSNGQGGQFTSTYYE